MTGELEQVSLNLERDDAAADPNYSKIEKDWVRGGHAARGRRAMMPPGHWMRRLGYGPLPEVPRTLL